MSKVGKGKQQRQSPNHISSGKKQLFLYYNLTMIVAASHHCVQVLLLTVLCDDAEAEQVTVATGNVKRCVPSVVHQRGITAGYQEMLAHVGLVCYYR